jgi:hypothetical protein
MHHGELALRLRTARNYQSLAASAAGTNVTY